jgi:flavin-dependent dehydrogenase
MYDAIIVGARCAGSPTAMLLARRGHRVLLLDRACFPSDAISTHMVWPPGVARLERWGLADAVAASGCPPIQSLRFDVGDFALAGVPPPSGDTARWYAPRRTVLDDILVKAAVAAGAELREEFAVHEVTTDAGRVDGIRGRAGATVVTERARIVIGADGMHSVVAREVCAPAYNVKPPLACYYYTYWSGVPLAGAEYYVRPGRTFGAISTNDGLVCVPVAWTREEFPVYRANVEANYLKTLDLAPGLAERVRAGTRVERFYGTADVPNFFRQSHGPGWALVGDAGYHKDPITAQGISDAFLGADLLIEAVDDALSGRRPFDDALAEYQRRRDDAVSSMYDFTCQLAAQEPPPPELQQLFGALRGNERETNRFLGTIAGTVSIPEFFSEENRRRIVGG